MLNTIIIGFICFLLLVFLIEIIRRKYTRKDSEGKEVIPKQENITENEEVCCGMHEVCEKNKLLKTLNKDIEYYDDEELDIYKGRPSDNYTDQESEEFREILYTMLEKDTEGWINSLQKRGIELPDQIKDEILLIIGKL